MAAPDVQAEAEHEPQEQEEILQAKEAPDLARAAVAPDPPPLEETGEQNVQPKLAIGAPGDSLEQEADAVADRVVQRMESGGIGGDSPPAVQAKCTACREEDETLRRQADGESEDKILRAKAEGTQEGRQLIAHVVQQSSIDRDSVGQSNEKRGLSPISPDRQRHGLRRKINPAQSALQREAERDSEMPQSAPLEQRLSSSGSGQSLAPSVQRNMEGAFGVDFSAVRIHTGENAQQLNRDLNARAFTHGTDIHFNSGEYQPSSPAGQHLLAHELTHVVQQSGGLQRQRDEEESPPIASIQTKRIQRAFIGTLSFGPRTRIPAGSLIHQEALPLFAESINPDLFVEAKIPGANKEDVDTGKWGIADFYRGKPSDRTIGIKFTKEGEPDPLGADGKLKFGGGKYQHGPNSAPRGFERNPKIRRIDVAPTSVQIGDLKPGHSGEIYLGINQLSNYRDGITNTATLVNDYLKAQGSTDTWNVTPSNMSSLKVPDKLSTVSNKGFYYGPLTVYENGKKRVVDTDMNGSMIVYKSSTSGIWAYEWVPESIPATTGSGEVNNVLTRLRSDVIDKITDTGKKTGARKAKSNAKLTKVRKKAAPATKKTIRRKGFDYPAWKTSYKTWKGSAEKFLGNEREQEKLATLEAIEGANKRTGAGPAIPADVKERIKGAEQIKHWNRLGGLYGWLRNTFDGVYTKIADFAQKVKKKIQGFLKSGSGSGFGNWIKAAAKAIFKVFKFVGSWAVNQVLDKLLSSLQEGITSNLKKLAESVTPEGVKSKIEEIQALKANYEALLKETQESLEKRFFGDKLELFSKLDEFMSIANTVSTIVSVVKWGIRIIACASPPLLGCLWNLAIAALEYAFSKLMETCWFSQKTFKWIKDFNISTILNFPATIASFIVKEANTAIPLPEGVDPLFAPININKDDFKMECGSGSGSGGGTGGGAELTPEQEALLQLVQDIGEDKFNALIELMLKHGAGPHVQLTAERLAELKLLLEKVNAEDLKKLAEGKPGDKTVGLEEFLKTIATYTAAETKATEERKIDYENAKRSNPKYEKSIGWKPELFVDHGIAPDSQEFADAVYDIQKLLGFKKPDGMMGPHSTVTFYDKNGIAKDSAYKNAVQLVKQEEQAKADKTAAEERRKEIEALLKDEKFQAARNAPFPSDEQLKKDLTPLNWEVLPDDSAQFIEVNGRAIVVIKTDAGHRVGAYFHYVEREFNGVTMPMIVKTSRLYALDDISTHEFITFIFFDKKRNPTIELRALKAHKKNSFFEMGPSFLVAKFVRIQ